MAVEPNRTARIEPNRCEPNRTANSKTNRTKRTGTNRTENEPNRTEPIKHEPPTNRTDHEPNRYKPEPARTEPRQSCIYIQKRPLWGLLILTHALKTGRFVCYFQFTPFWTYKNEGCLNAPTQRNDRGRGCKPKDLRRFAG